MVCNMRNIMMHLNIFCFGVPWDLAKIRLRPGSLWLTQVTELAWLAHLPKANRPVTFWFFQLVSRLCRLRPLLQVFWAADGLDL